MIKFIIMLNKIFKRSQSKQNKIADKDRFEILFNEAIKDKGYQFLSDKSTAYYWYKKGMEERL